MRALRTPCTLNPIYGLLWWLNTNRGMYPAAPETSLFAMGMGTNLIWLDPERDLVVVVRWIAKDKVNDLIGKISASLRA